MNRRPILIADADAIIAQSFPHDANHQKAVTISQKLVNIEAQVLYPVTAITEAVTFMQRVLNSGATAYGTAMVFTQPNSPIVEVNNKTYILAVDEYFRQGASKKHTLFDCIVAATAQENNADAIFSFDRFYKSKGFILAEEFLNNIL